MESSEIDESIKQFFSDEKWKELSDYEKVRFSNAKKNHDMLVTIGLEPKLPNFMEPGGKRKRTANIQQRKTTTNLPKGVALIKSEPDNPEMDQQPEEMPENIQQFIKKLTSKALENSFTTAGYFKMQKGLADKDNITNIKSGLDVNSELEQDSLYVRTRRAKRICYAEPDGEEEDEEPSASEESPVDSDDEWHDEDEMKLPVIKKCVTKECDCDKSNKRYCLQHCPLTVVENEEAPKQLSYSAARTMPNFLSIAESSIDISLLGVWSESSLASGLVFGPYEGRISIYKEDEATEEIWLVWKEKQINHRISNWLGYINYSEKGPNLIAFQYKKMIFYRTCRDILPHTELLVWYGDDYALDLGLSPKSDEQTDFPDLKYECRTCHAFFSDCDTLQRHSDLHSGTGPNHKYKCKHCPYTGTSTGIMSHHVWTMHTRKQNHVCGQCNMTYDNEPKLKDHQQIYSGHNQSHLCPQCSKTFTSLFNLMRHNRAAHKKRISLIMQNFSGYFQ